LSSGLYDKAHEELIGIGATVTEARQITKSITAN